MAYCIHSLNINYDDDTSEDFWLEEPFLQLNLRVALCL